MPTCRQSNGFGAIRIRMSERQKDASEQLPNYIRRIVSIFLFFFFLCIRLAIYQACFVAKCSNGNNEFDRNHLSSEFSLESAFRGIFRGANMILKCIHRYVGM